jgi:hypothetical protein
VSMGLAVDRADRFVEGRHAGNLPGNTLDQELGN